MITTEEWIVSPCGDVRTAVDDKFVATTYGSGAQKKERAHLMAASPKLYAALQRVTRIVSATETPETHDAVVAALDALAQAEGRAA